MKVKFIVLSFLPVLLPFSACVKKAEQENPKIHEIRFGILDGAPERNEINYGFRFRKFIYFNLKTDSLLAKENQHTMEEYMNGRKPAEYFADNITKEIRKIINDLDNRIMTYEKGVFFHSNSGPIALDSSPKFYLEYRKDTVFRYFYMKPIGYDELLSELTNNLLKLNFDRDGFKKVNLNLKDDSLIASIYRVEQIKNFAPPPVAPDSIASKISFELPVEKKSKKKPNKNYN